jgi:hypothetical protein
LASASSIVVLRPLLATPYTSSPTSAAAATITTTGTALRCTPSRVRSPLSHQTARL